MSSVHEILKQSKFSKSDLVHLLEANEHDSKLIFQKSSFIKNKYVGNKVYYRGLVEFSNICSKDCYYCGIRKSNLNLRRYDLNDKEILTAVKFAYDNKYGSIILQSGERSNKQFVNRINELIKKIKILSEGKLGITLSLGEQTQEVYKKWFESGAHRYLLRIETSSKTLYNRIHPLDKFHDFEKRLEALRILQNIGYQTGSGVMIGLPFQTTEDLADDLLFFKEFNIDMVGLGPYIEHEQTPLFDFRQMLMPVNSRFYLTLKMIAILRIMMKDINIAASTALQAIDPLGREKAIQVGANIIMPNITPTAYRKEYQLYQNKPCIDESAGDCTKCLETRINLVNNVVGYGEWGDSKNYYKRTRNTLQGVK